MNLSLFGFMLAGLGLVLGGVSVPVFPSSTPLPLLQVILVGDSTLAPKNGYGDALCARFTPTVKCVNLAKNGRSSASYRAEGSWQLVLDLLRQAQGALPTYVLIEFGHNDQPGKPGRSTDLATEFPSNLRTYVQEVRALGGVPILATPLSRRNFKGDQLIHDLEPWADATRRVADDEKVPLLELLQTSSADVQAMGHAQADTLAVEPAPPSHMAEVQGQLPMEIRGEARGLNPSRSVATVGDLNQQEVVSTKKSGFDHTHVGPVGAAFFAAQVEALVRKAMPELQPYFQSQESRP